MTITIRDATDVDLPALIGLLRVMHAEVGIGRLDEPKAVGMISHVLTSGAVFVAELDGAIVGSVGLTADSWWYSQDRFLTDVWTFVHPDARKTRAAALLIGEARAMAKRLGAPLVLGLFNRVEIDRKAQFYQRLGLEPVGVWFFQEA
ncbi:GNAT family N-acetyltransferase [Azospirillum sp. TSA2s]|uniref:GNAT family N-acetyltransferase n=1 Tax=Azospirillum sp. TSA2s TaxID=709810 RepID=UPI0010A9C61E|nr:GNAT family N-acetyltransferase [Azospirillum sp. TSA2s]QCG94968.1 GNAT family N-acetyltransferase [Azospirillum sp. TSA2s]